MTTPRLDGFAPASAGIPTVGTTAERNARYPTPPTGFKVYNVEIGGFQRYAGSAWLAFPLGPGDVTIYGAVGDGVTDDTAAIQAAVTGANGGAVIVPDGTYKITAPLVLPAGTRLIGGGPNKAKLQKAFNGDLLTITDAPYVAVEGIYLVGGDNLYTGRAIVVSGSTSIRPRFANIVTEAFSGGATPGHITFGADAGQLAMVSDWYARIGALTDFRALHLDGPDTTAAFRQFVNCVAGLGYHDVAGGQDNLFVNCSAKRWETDAATTILGVHGCVWANLGTAMTLHGASCCIVGNRFAGDVTLAADFINGSFVGNIQTSTGYTFTDSTVLGSTQVVHLRYGEAYQRFGHLTASHTITPREITAHRVGSNVGDASRTLTLDVGETVVRFGSAITADRDLNLPAAARDGTLIRVVREAAATGAFNVNVKTSGGSTLKALGSAGTWCDVMWDGPSAAFILVAGGNL